LLRRRTILACACVAGAAALAPGSVAARPAEHIVMSGKNASVPTSTWPGTRLQHSYLGLHEKAARSGAEPGRNILLHGVETDEGDVRTARRGELRRSIRILKRMTAPAPAPANEASAPAPSASGELEAIAACESGGDPTAVGGGGMYRGKYQFTYETWQSVGGTGDPAAAPEAEQDRRAAMLLAQGRAGQWPACGG
jgi:Transglycosylase-like domain